MLVHDLHPLTWYDIRHQDPHPWAIDPDSRNAKYYEFTKACGCRLKPVRPHSRDPQKVEICQVHQGWEQGIRTFRSMLSTMEAAK